MNLTLVTGAGSGLGRALVAACLGRGHDVLAVVRPGTHGDAFQSRGPGKVRDVLACDLADPGAVTALTADPRLGEVDLAVFCAGALEAGAVDQAPAAAFRRSLELHFLSPLTLMQTLTSGRTPCRRFVVILSGTGDLLVPGLGPYALGKRALRDVLTLRDMESAFPGCQILAVRPGPLDTAFDRKAVRHGGGRIPHASALRPPEAVARAILDALDAGRTSLNLSPGPRLAGMLQAVMPGLVARLIRRHPAFNRTVPTATPPEGKGS